MRRVLALTALALGLAGGVASADRWRGDRDRGRDRGPEVRDHRGDRDRGWNDRGWNDRGWNDRRWDRRDRRDRIVRIRRERPSFRDGRFYFAGGFYRTYNRPTIQYRYRDYYRRPALVVENYDAVPGYIWVQGNWNWNGYEWIWMSGHYEVDQNYVDYDNDGYYDGNYDSNYYSPGVSVQGSINW